MTVALDLRLGLKLAAKVRGRIGEMAQRDGLDVGERRLGGRTRRAQDPRQAGRRAASASARTPPTGRSRPSRASSPTAACSASRSRGICPEAARIERAIGRSKPEPSFRSPAGARLTVIRRSGHSSSADVIPLRTRSFASEQARSASPTIAKAGTLFWRWASTSTRRASSPTRACVTVRASTGPRLGCWSAHVCAGTGPKRRTPHRRHVRRWPPRSRSRLDSIAVKTTPRNEVRPGRRRTTGSRGRGAASGRRAPSTSAPSARAEPFRVNRRDPGVRGGIDGTRLVYQVIRGGSRSLRPQALRPRDESTLRIRRGINTRTGSAAGRSRATGSSSAGARYSSAGSSSSCATSHRRAARTRHAAEPEGPRQRGPDQRHLRRLGPLQPVSAMPGLPLRHVAGTATALPVTAGRCRTPVGQPVRNGVLHAATGAAASRWSS